MSVSNIQKENMYSICYGYLLNERKNALFVDYLGKTYCWGNGKVGCKQNILQSHI